MSTHMGSMNISIRDEVYRELKRRRAEGESFSDVIERLMARPAKLSDYFGAWADMSDEERREMEAYRKRSREIDAQHERSMRRKLDRLR